MQGLKWTALIAATVFSAQSPALEFWHSSTVWAGQGMCSAVFTFDSGGFEAITDLKVEVSAVEKSGKVVATDLLEIKEFGAYQAARYADAFLESEAICNDELSIVVNKATATIDGKPTDLLQTENLSVREFKPFKIEIGQ